MTGAGLLVACPPQTLTNWNIAIYEEKCSDGFTTILRGELTHEGPHSASAEEWCRTLGKTFGPIVFGPIVAVGSHGTLWSCCGILTHFEATCLSARIQDLRLRATAVGDLFRLDRR